MKIKFVEIQNFRKLKSVRIDLSDEKTIFVGANNSGKTTAIVALRKFLIEQKYFDVNDFTVTNWRKINDIGKNWEEKANSTHEIDDWESMLPAIDVWLNVDQSEIHYVQHLLPKKENKDDLLKATVDDKTFVDKEANFSVRVVYQLPVNITLDTSKEATSITPNTFEDALLFANIEIFKNLEGDGLIKKFRTALAEQKTSQNLSTAILEALKTGNKAEFALELLFHKDPQDFAVPYYIDEGLKWLEDQVTRHEDKTAKNDNKKVPKEEAA